MRSKTENRWQRYGISKNETPEERVPGVRLCITSACNFRCYYCSPSGESYCGENNPLKTTVFNKQNLYNLLKALEHTGFKEIRWSGGEPLLALNMILPVMTKLKKESTKLSFGLTTNGFLLEKSVKDLKKADLSELVLSLDSLDKNKIKQITKVDALDAIFRGVNAAKGQVPIRLNIVLTKDNFEERWDFVEYALANNLDIKFLDLDFFRNPGEKIWDEKFVALTSFVEELKSHFGNYREIWRTGGTGIPMTLIEKDKIKIVVKDSTRGTHYTIGCKSCDLYPINSVRHYCQEGLYEMFITSDGRCTICKHRLDKGIDLSQFGLDKIENIEKGLNRMLEYYSVIKFRPKENEVVSYEIQNRPK